MTRANFVALFMLLIIAATFAAISTPHAGEAGEINGDGPARIELEPNQKSILDEIKIKGFVDAGISINPALPFSNLNFGQLYTDKANTPQLNQTFLTAEKPFTNSPDEFDYRLMLQTLYGADARFHHVLGETEYLLPSRNQFSVVEAYAQFHYPIITNNGLDIKIGQYISYNAGIENIPSIDNLFYTRSYIYNAGPAQHVGLMGITHIADWMDIYTGVDSGVNTSLGWPGDNNAAAAIHTGIWLRFIDNKLTISAFSHSGPENPMQRDPYNIGWPNIPLECGCDPNKTWRYFNNLTILYEPSNDWKFLTDIAYYRDDGWNTFSSSGLSQNTLYLLDSFYNTNFSNLPQKARGVQAFGIAQYISYRYDDMTRINGRLEFWRDANNFFTNSFPAPFSNSNSAHGFPADVVSQPIVANNPSDGTTYLAATVGVNFSLKLDRQLPIQEITLRPEARFDFALNHTAPFIGSNTEWGRTSQKTISMDVLVPFTIK